jgi:hypothetical protein
MVPAIGASAFDSEARQKHVIMLHQKSRRFDGIQSFFIADKNGYVNNK